MGFHFQKIDVALRSTCDKTFTASCHSNQSRQPGQIVTLLVDSIKVFTIYLAPLYL